MTRPALLSASYALCAAMLLVAWHLAWFQAWELSAYDRVLRSRPALPADPRILIVGVTEQDIQDLQWPLPDAAIAQAIEALLAQGASVVGVDLYRDHPVPPGSAALQLVFQDPRVIAIQEISSRGGQGIPAPPGIPAERVGMSDLVTDPDGVLRRALLYLLTADGQLAETLPLRLARYYLRPDRIEVQATADDPNAFTFGAARFAPLPPRGGGYADIDSGGFQVMLNYRPGNRPADQVSLGQLLAGQVPAEQLRGKAVLLGTVARSLRDFHLTPYSDRKQEVQFFAGVDVHAHLLSFLLSAATHDAKPPAFGYPGVIRTAPAAVDVGWLLGWMLVAALLAWRIRQPWWSLLALVGGPALPIATASGLLYLDCWLPQASAALGYFLVYLAFIGLRLSYAYWTDSVTGLPNRNALHLHLAPARRVTGSERALLVVHVGRYDAVRGLYTEQTAADLMSEMAALLRRQQWRAADGRPIDGRVFRVGAADFAVLLDGNAGAPTSNAFETLCRELEQPLSVSGHALYAGACSGLSQETAGDIRPLLDEAYAAMHEARVLGHSGVQLYSEQARRQRLTRLRLEQALRHALRDVEQGNGGRRFPVYYQPLVTLATGRVAGFEALIRWIGDDDRLISPAEFIPVAEQSDVIIGLGDWVLRQACDQLIAWQQTPGNADLFISVNVASRQLADGDRLVAKVRRLLDDTGLNPATLKLEITESAGLGDMQRARATLDKLHGLGVRLSADDFGTGYSSLSYLTELPFDTLKIDQCFVRPLDSSKVNREVIQAALSLAQRLGIETVAEGIEREEHAATLRQWQADLGQGYLFGRPMPADQAQAMLATRGR